MSTDITQHCICIVYQAIFCIPINWYCDVCRGYADLIRFYYPNFAQLFKHIFGSTSSISNKTLWKLRNSLNPEPRYPRMIYYNCRPIVIATDMRWNDCDKLFKDDGWAVSNQETLCFKEYMMHMKERIYFEEKSLAHNPIPTKSLGLFSPKLYFNLRLRFGFGFGGSMYWFLMHIFQTT